MKKEKTGYPSIDQTHKKGNTYIQNNPIIPNMSIYNAIKLLSTFYRKNAAIDCLDLSANYGELINDAARLSKAFKELGVKSGEIISVAMPNFYQAVVVFLAANRIGAITTFLNGFAEKEEIKDYLNLFESPIFINYDKDNDYNKEIKRDTKVRQTITLHKNEINLKAFNTDSKIIGYNDFLSFRDMGLVADCFKSKEMTNFGKEQESLILFTSGTTGKPKSVLLTNQNILAIGTYLKNMTGISSFNNEKCFAGVPFSYPYGLVTSTLLSLLCGRCVVLGPNLSKFNISYYLKKKPNIIFGSPALLDLIIRNIPENQDLSSIETFISGGDFLTKSHCERGKEFFAKHNANPEFSNGAGNAETTGGNTNTYGVSFKEGTVGKILYGTDAIIINPDTNEELKYGEEGMLCISGKHMFNGYYKNPELTNEATFMYKGKKYFKTGTMGFLDEEGYFTLTGRASRFYIISTLNKVYCDHIQTIISSFDCVESCAVVQKPHDELLFTSKAYIVLKPNVKSCQEIKEYILSLCQTQVTINNENMELKPYEIPSSIEFIDELPKTSADKVNYKYLEELAINEFNEEKQQNNGVPIVLKK